MSHNNLKLGTAEPDRVSDVTPSLSDLNNVSSTAPTDGQYLKYDTASSEWKPGAGTSGTSSSVEHIWIGEGASQTYPVTWANGGDVYFYGSTVVNTITGATVSSSPSHTNWYNTFNLPSGTYMVFARAVADFSSSSGQLQYTVTSGGTARASGPE